MPYHIEPLVGLSFPILAVRVNPSMDVSSDFPRLLAQVNIWATQPDNESIYVVGDITRWKPSLSQTIGVMGWLAGMNTTVDTTAIFSKRSHVFLAGHSEVVATAVKALAQPTFGGRQIHLTASFDEALALIRRRRFIEQARRLGSSSQAAMD